MKASQPNSSPRVSVIVPAYNTAHLVADCLGSIFSQTYTDFEVIVVNDGSPDTPELEKVLQRCLGRIVYIKQENKRAAGARNTAIGKAQGEFLAFLDSDDTWLPNHLASQMQLLRQDATLDMVYGNALMVGDPARTWEFMERCPSQGEATFEALVVERCQVATSTVVVRKSSVTKAGLFDESLARCDDYDLWLRTAFHGARIGYTRKVQARLNGGCRPGSLGQSRAKMAEAYWKILENAEANLPLSTSQRSLVRQRAEDIQTRYLVEEGKCYLSEKRFDKARELLSEANRRARRSKLTLTLLGLKIAPSSTSKLISLGRRIRGGAEA